MPAGALGEGRFQSWRPKEHMGSLAVVAEAAELTDHTGLQEAAH